MKSVQASGALTTPANMVFVMMPGAAPMTVKHQARIVASGNLVPHVSNTLAHKLHVTAMKLSLSRGSAMQI